MTPSLRAFILRSVGCRRQSPRLRMSQAGSNCVRQTYYEATGAEREPDTEEGAVKMALGTAFDEYSLQNAPQALHEEELTLTQKTVTIKAGDLTLTGHADLVFVGKKGPVHVGDLKVVGEKTWEKVQERPKQEHQAQVNLYAFGLGCSTWSVCYVRAGTGEILEHYGATDDFAARRDLGMFEEAAYWIGKGVPPPRPYEDFEEEDGTVKRARDSFPCGWCKFNDHCWGARDASPRKGENHGKPVPGA